MKKGMPQIGAGIDYILIGERPDQMIIDNGKNAFLPTVSMSLPLFRGKYKAAVKESQKRQELLKYEKQAMYNSLLADIEEAIFEMKRAVKLYDLYDSQIKKTNDVIELLYTAYSNSGKDFEEVLKAQRQLLNYQSEKATAVSQYYNALSELEFLTAKGN